MVQLRGQARPAVTGRRRRKLACTRPVPGKPEPSPASADDHGDNGDNATTLAQSVGWEYVRSGRVSEGDRILTITAALHAREARRAARDMLAELAPHHVSGRDESGIEP